VNGAVVGDVVEDSREDEVIREFIEWPTSGIKICVEANIYIYIGIALTVRHIA